MSGNVKPATEWVHQVEREEWPEPIPIGEELLPVPPFDSKLLPGALRDRVMDVAERMSCPAEMPAITILGALSAVIGRRFAIYPKQHDDWFVIPNLWGMVIGRPGSKKSPACREALAPLQVLEEQAMDEYEEQHLEYNRKLAKTSVSRDEPPEPPLCKRYIVNDTTVEKLVEILQGNPCGVLLWRDELRGFFEQLTRQGREGDRQFYLEAWNGSSGYTTDRIKRGTMRAKYVCISVLGTIQPGPVSRYVSDAISGGGGADGLMSRFQLAVYPDPVDYHRVDRAPMREAKKQVGAIFERLHTIGDGHNPLPVRFHAEAQEAANSWHDDLERSLRTGGDDDAIIEHLSKYRSLFPSLALIYEIADWAARPRDGQLTTVSLQSAQRAAAMCGLLEAHARRIYQLGTRGDASPATLLAKRITSGALGKRFTRRDIVRKEWAGLKGDMAINVALQLLIDCNWLRTEDTRSDNPRGGRPRQGYIVNPRLSSQTEER